MKKFVIMLAIVLMTMMMASVVLAEVSFHNANQVTLAWDAVTTDVDGDPITGVTYKMWLANADTDPTKTNPVIVKETADTQATITLNVKGRYFVGIQAWLGDLSSVINWADEPTYQGTIPLFGLRFAVPPGVPKNLVR